MASCRGTIRPVSPLASHTSASFHLETVHLLENQIAASCEKDKAKFVPRHLQGVQKFPLATALVVLVALLCMNDRALEAQSTFGSIRGTVEDSTGASVPDTLITLHSIDENTNRTVKADATGGYAFENVLANNYSIRAQHDGFGETVVGRFTLAARQVLRFALVMKISEQQTTIEVTSAASQINTENGVIGDSKGTGDIGQLPLNFRASTTSPLAALATSSNVQQDSQGNVGGRIMAGASAVAQLRAARLSSSDAGALLPISTECSAWAYACETSS